MRKNIKVRYWINIGGVYSEHLASIYHKVVVISANNKTQILEDEFTGYFGDTGTYEERLKVAREKWHNTLNNLILNPQVQDAVIQGTKQMRENNYLKFIKLKEFHFDYEEADIMINIELELY